MSQALCEAFYLYSFFSVLAANLDITVMTLHTRKLRHREVKKIIQGHKVYIVLCV